MPSVGPTTATTVAKTALKRAAVRWGAAPVIEGGAAAAPGAAATAPIWVPLLAVAAAAVATYFGVKKASRFLDGHPVGSRPLRHDLPEGGGRGSYDTEPLPEPAPAPAPAPKPAPSPVPAPRPNPDEEDKKKSKEILFGQARIDRTFSTKDGVPKEIAGKSLIEVRDMLLSGKLSPDQLQIEYFRDGQYLVAVNNRGLATLSMAGMKPTNVKEKVPSKKRATPTEGTLISRGPHGTQSTDNSRPDDAV